MGYVSPFLLVAASAAIGKKEEALRYTRFGLERRDPNFSSIYPAKVDVKPLFAIPELREMMNKVGLY